MSGNIQSHQKLEGLGSESGKMPIAHEMIPGRRQALALQVSMCSCDNIGGTFEFGKAK
jgi:hypothetical protein